MLYADDIKIGILSNVKKRLIKRNGFRTMAVTIGRDLRGTLFTINDDEKGSDILYPIHNYPLLTSMPIYEPTMGITNYESLTTLLKSSGLDEFTYEDLNKFLDDILLNEKWLQENSYLFGLDIKKYGPIRVEHSYNGFNPFSKNLGRIIYKIHDLHGFNLSNQEKKQYSLRK